ncbi:MAG: hypothetical protein LBJ00_01430 [Planctomycetaceae bacterium]|nr:hypothetical protein [Planctomycetaceae bacterium]
MKIRVYDSVYPSICLRRRIAVGCVAICSQFNFGDRRLYRLGIVGMNLFCRMDSI